MEEGDTCVEKLGVKLLVDPMSIQYLTGAEIDYKEDLQGAQFVIRNPTRRRPVAAGRRSRYSRAARAHGALDADPRPDRLAEPVRSDPVARRDAPQIIAGVDLGSNSFHMLVARYAHGQLTTLDRLNEMVRFAMALDERGRLVEDNAQSALACLERFGQRLRDMHADNVRAVGTNTFRRAKNAQAS